MRKLTIGFLLILAVPAAAKEASAVASDQTSYIRALGRLNVNTATKEQLVQVPGLDSTKVDAILRTRAQAPISDVTTLAVPEEVENHLKTEGDSTFYRIRQNPLRRVDQSPASAAH